MGICNSKDKKKKKDLKKGKGKGKGEHNPYHSNKDHKSSSRR